STRRSSDLETAAAYSTAGQGQRAGLHQHSALIVQREAEIGSAGACRLLERTVVSKESHRAVIGNDTAIAFEIPSASSRVDDRRRVVDQQGEAAEMGSYIGVDEQTLVQGGTAATQEQSALGHGC